MKRHAALIITLLFVFTTAAAGAPRDRDVTKRDRPSLVKIVKKVVRALADLPTVPKPGPCTPGPGCG